MIARPVSSQGQPKKVIGGAFFYSQARLGDASRRTYREGASLAHRLAQVARQ